MYSIAYLNHYITYCRHLLKLSNEIQPPFWGILVIISICTIIWLFHRTDKELGNEWLTDKQTKEALRSLLLAIVNIIVMIVLICILCVSFGGGSLLNQQPIRIAEQDKEIYNNKKYKIPEAKKEQRIDNDHYKYDAHHQDSDLYKHQDTAYWKNQFNKQDEMIKVYQLIDHKGYKLNGHNPMNVLPKNQTKHLTQYSGYHKLPKITWNNKHFPHSRIGYVF